MQPSPYDLWASAEMVALIREAQVFRPALRAAFVINRRVSTTIIGGKRGSRWPNSRRRRCVAKYVSASSSPTAWPPAGSPARRHPTTSPPARLPRSPMNCCGGRHEQPAQQARWHRRTSARESARRGVDSPGRCRCAQQGRPYTARLTLDVTPALRARIKIAAFGQGVTVAELLRGLLEREFPDKRLENPP